jgi:hypothetical protein
MKKLNVVRWATFLVVLLAKADAVETKMMVDRSTNERHAKCERCGQTGPTVPVVPVVFSVRPEVGFEVRRVPGNTDLGTETHHVWPASVLPVRDEFPGRSVTPAVGAAMTR